MAQIIMNKFTRLEEEIYGEKETIDWGLVVMGLIGMAILVLIFHLLVGVNL